ncbi:hypothetical protein THAOC_08665, partial [Thalassiosira oceanica]
RAPAWPSRPCSSPSRGGTGTAPRSTGLRPPRPRGPRRRGRAGRGGSGAGSSSAPSMLSSMVSRLRPTPDGGAAVPARPTLQTSWRTDVRGGAFKSKTAAVEEFGEQTTRTFMGALRDLNKYMKGPKSDTLCLLLATALITPLCKSAGLSPILGFLASGMLLGPNGLGVISGIHNTEHLGELGIVFFLFEMGIELSVERLKSMKKDVFGLGLSQYLSTAAVIGLAAKVLGGLSGPASVVVGGALSLSSSAFVLQLLKDKKELATRFGKASFGVLLLQDLAVVPLLVATPILAGSGSLASALGNACVKAGMALSGIALAGRFALNPLFKTVAAANSQEAFLGLILMTALGMSFLTEGLGLSNTLGAFLAGVLLSETKYRYQVEADIAPFRGILLGLFFVTVGFEIDVGLIASNLPRVSAIVAGILGLKAGILALLSKAFGLSTSNALRTGLILSQGGGVRVRHFRASAEPGHTRPGHDEDAADECQPDHGADAVPRPGWREVREEARGGRRLHALHGPGRGGHRDHRRRRLGIRRGGRLRSRWQGGH